MKITTILIFAALMQVSAAGLAQKITLNVKNASLESVIDKVRSQTGFEFIFNVKDVDNAKKVTLNIKAKELDDALEELFENQDLSYSIKDKFIVLKPKDKSFIENIIARFQAIDVRGKVVDSLGNGLAGATVSVKNGKASTSTDNNGNFYLKNVEEGSVLVVQYLGYVTKEQVVSKDFTYVTLQMSTSKLDEVQVQAYGLTSRRLSTGNIATIKAEEIEKQPVDNPLLALMGRVPGLIITPSSGLPGAPISVQLRGQNSINRTNNNSVTSSEPLFIIDGVPFTNNLMINAYPSRGGAEISALRFINPKDIESIDVLKDGDATSIYGSRGANGVILITTKKGKTGDTRININSTFGFTKVAKKLNLLNTQEYLEMRKEAFLNDGLSIPDFSSEKNSTNYDLTLWDQNRYTDWQEVLAGGKAEQYNLQGTISGGNQNLSYVLNGNYSSQGSVFPGDSKDIIGGARINIQGVSPNGKFRTNISTSFGSNNSSRPDFTSMSIGLAPNAPKLYNSDGTLNWEPDATGLASWNNPIARLRNVAEVKSNLVTGGMEMSYLLLSSLQIKVNGAFTKSQGNSFMPDKIASQDPFNRGILTGTSRFASNRYNSWSFEPQVNFQKNFRAGKLTAVLGGSLQGENRYDEVYEAIGYTNDDLLRSLAAAGSISSKANASREYKYIGIFGRVNYNWEDKYLVNVSARRDGSSRFGPGNQFGNFWSLGTAWVFSNEKFLNDNSILSFGKLRFSYGTSGNDAIGDYRYLELYKFDQNANSDPIYQGGRQLVTSGAINPYYHWEQTRKMEGAIEIGFFKDRVFLSFSKFQNRSSDQLGDYRLPATGGNTTIIVNRPAKIQNTGTEITFDSKNIRSKSFSWITAGNFSIQNNKLLSLPEGFFTPGLELYGPDIDPIGKPFSGFVNVRKYIGVDPNTGLYQFSDVEGEVAIDPNSAYRYARSITTDPKFTGGLRNTFTYLGFSLDIFFDFAKQMGRNYVFDNQFMFPGLFSSDPFADIAVANMPVEVLKRWRESNRNSDIQKFTQDYATIENYINAQGSDIAWVDASYIKLRNVAISYNIPQKILHRLKLQSLAFNIQGQNLFTITKYKGPDPQTQNVGLLSQLRAFTAGISIGL